MRGKLKRCVSAMMILAFAISLLPGRMIVNANEEEPAYIEIIIEKEGLSEAVAAGGMEGNIGDIENLRIVTENDYAIQEADYLYIEANCISLKELDLRECIFDSEAVKEMFERQEDYICYVSDEQADEIQDIPDEDEQADEIQDIPDEDEQADETRDTPDEDEQPGEIQDVPEKDKQPDETQDDASYSLKGLTVSLNGIAVIDKGGEIQLGSVYSSSDPNVKFRWQIYNTSTGVWKTISDWQSGNWSTWRNVKKGSYWICVQAKLSDGTMKQQIVAYNYKGAYIDLKGIFAFIENKSVKAGAVTSTNCENIEYRWLVYDYAGKKWSGVSDWNKSNWLAWHPSKAGRFWIRVEARSSAGASANLTIEYNVPRATITSLTANPDTPNWPGKTINIAAKYSDPVGYAKSSQILVYNGKTWTELAKNAASATWTPVVTGSYLICFQLFDANGKAIAQSFKAYNIENPYLNISGISISKKSGLTYTVSANVSTNDKATQYKWMYYDVSGKAWHSITGWQGNKSITWTAPKTGSYWLHVEAKTHNGITKSYTKAYNVTKTKLLGSFATLCTNTEGSYYNMSLAINRCNNIVLKPGETFSFSAVTGPWTGGNGYVIGGVVGGVGYGGGVCQASTTLYGAVIRAGLTIVERRNHSVPSTYVPIGLDAMVASGSSDFKFRNDMGHSVTIKTWVSDRWLNVEIHGQDPEWYDNIEPYSWKTGSNTASAVRVYYKGGQEVYRENLPNSRY